jgi:hypothetical protein
MTSDRVFRSASSAAASAKAYLRRRTISGEPLTLLIIGISIVGGIALAIACSYRPIALWWVMIGCSAINLVRLGMQLARDSREKRPGAPSPRSPLGLVARALVWAIDTAGSGRSRTSKSSLDRQHARFLVWFAEHNLLWTTVGFGLSLLLWHRFGPTTPALVVMAALMSCGLLAALGTIVGARAPTLGLCWRELCPTPNVASLERIVQDVGCVLVLANRRDYAARSDWEKGGRFHELFLTVDELARAGVEPGLEAVLAADDPVGRRALARKERLDRALALTPVFVVGLLAAMLAVPHWAGSEPLPSLWTILTSSANASERASADSDENSRDLPGGTAQPSTSRQTQKTEREESRSAASSRAGGNPTTNPSQTGSERPDMTGRGTETALAGDGAASGQGAEAEGAAARGGQGGGAGPGSAGSNGGASSKEGSGPGSSGGGGGPRGYGTSGVAPQRAESPTAVPDVPVNPGKAIEVVLPPFAQARADSPDDEPADKRKGDAPGGAQVYQPQRGTTAAAKETVTREPVQRLPNWIIQLLRK